MEIAGYAAALLIGLSLGLVGGGGSILTVPILVYLFSITPILATSYSLFIVGVTSLVGSLTNFAAKQVHFKTVAAFGGLSVLTVIGVRHYIIPHLPPTLDIAGNLVSVPMLTMLVFAVLMILSSSTMIRSTADRDVVTVHKAGFLKIALSGIAVGLITGLLGAGGGFLLIPALVLWLRLPVKTAIGTSLVIISINSLIGFAEDVTHHTMEWPLLLKLTAIAVVGVVAGTTLGSRLNGNTLKKGFGWFILIIGIYIIIHEIVLLTSS